MSDVLTFWMSDDGRITYRIISILVNSGVQWGDIHVLDLLLDGFVGCEVYGSSIGVSSPVNNLMVLDLYNHLL